jgi:hypothetical protein
VCCICQPLSVLSCWQAFKARLRFSNAMKHINGRSICLPNLALHLRGEPESDTPLNLNIKQPFWESRVSLRGRMPPVECDTWRAAAGQKRTLTSTSKQFETCALTIQTHSTRQ